MSENTIDTSATEQKEEQTAEMQALSDQAQAPVSTADAEAIAALQAERDALKQELSQLRSEWEEQERIMRCRMEFCELYPDIDVDNLPEEVAAQTTLPLAAAYALYERKRLRAAQLAAQANAENEQKSSGAIHHDGEGDGEYTIDQIRRMSAGQVHRNYQSILHSLKRTKQK